MTFCLAFGEVEGPIADVHDGHGSQSETDLSEGPTISGNDVVVSSSSGDHPETEGAKHAPHLCHCTHAHGGILSRLDLAFGIPDGLIPAQQAPRDAYLSIAPEPPDHPPLG
jgi:hypothetical protein